VILATNVAETSLTLPRIRCVIDTGLARISRYNPRTRTKRLPVEEISQSSANQRAGRAGRLGPGIAIRLYSEEDFEKRARFTQPELQRANLAEVILRMKAFGLGEIETFPFLNPPVSASIRAGYRLLHELGALDELNQLTALGRELAKLPLDPVLGRMLLAGQTGAGALGGARHCRRTEHSRSEGKTRGTKGCSSSCPPEICPSPVRLSQPVGNLEPMSLGRGTWRQQCVEAVLQSTFPLVHTHEGVARHPPSAGGSVSEGKSRSHSIDCSSCDTCTATTPLRALG
jgi:hypothetical protein